jgi:sulfane dehydrogenase subunit SoxC
MVSADGGQSLAQAALQEPVHSRPPGSACPELEWRPGDPPKPRWDEAGNAQPTRAQVVALRGQTTKVPAVTAFPGQHYNAITSWAIDNKGEVKHVYA